MPNVIGWEIAVFVVLLLNIFGPEKLLELGSSLGKSIRGGFRKGLKGNEDEAKSTVSEIREAMNQKTSFLRTPRMLLLPGPRLPKRHRRLRKRRMIL